LKSGGAALFKRQKRGCIATSKEELQ